MAYNYYPNYLPQNYYQQQNQQIQNGGLVIVRSKAEAQNYPVAPGNSVTFKDESAPFVYTKTMGFSQLDRPVFETFRLIKEETPVEQARTDDTKSNIDLSPYALKSDFEALTAKLEALEAEINKKSEKKGKKDD